ncbi:MAG: prephenate dehydrogenase [Bacteroidales bacterium]
MESDSRPLPLVRPGPSPTADPPIFEHIGIIGLGLIGGSIALASRRLWPSALVIGVDSHEVLEQAVARHVIDVAAPDLTIVSEADLVILAAPVLANISLLGQLGECLEKPAIVTDVSSTKRAIVDAARLLPTHLAFVGGHPLAGATIGGVASAREDLFAGRPWFLTPTSRPITADSRGVDVAAADDPLTKLLRFTEALGAVPRTIEAAEHDRLMASLSHVPQLLATSLMATIGESVGEDALALAGRGLQDTTRLAASPANIWTDICRTNADQIAAALDRLIADLSSLRASLEDAEVVEQRFDAANRWREVLMRTRR